MASQPLCRCRVLYLGSAIPIETSVGLEAIQKPLAERYPIEQGEKVDGIDSALTVFGAGLQLQYIQDRSSLIWFPIQNLYVCAAVRCVKVENAATGEVSSKFVSLDSPTANDPLARHPPMFACIIRRSVGVKVLQCHVFICKSSQSAMTLVRACMQAYERKDEWLYNLPPAELLQYGGVGGGPDDTNNDLPEANALNEILTSTLNGRISGDQQNTPTDDDDYPRDRTQLVNGGPVFDRRRDLAKPYNLQYKINPGPRIANVNQQRPVPQMVPRGRIPGRLVFPRSRSVPVRLVRNAHTGQLLAVPTQTGAFPGGGAMIRPGTMVPPVSKTRRRAQLPPVVQRVVPVVPLRRRAWGSNNDLTMLYGSNSDLHSIVSAPGATIARPQSAIPVGHPLLYSHPHTAPVSPASYDHRLESESIVTAPRSDTNSLLLTTANTGPQRKTYTLRSTNRLSRKEIYEQQMRGEQFTTLNNNPLTVNGTDVRTGTLSNGYVVNKEKSKRRKDKRRLNAMPHGGHKSSSENGGDTTETTGSEVIFRNPEETRLFPRDWYNEHKRSLPNERAFSKAIRNQRNHVKEPDAFPSAYDINHVDASTEVGSADLNTSYQNIITSTPPPPTPPSSKKGGKYKKSDNRNFALSSSSNKPNDYDRHTKHYM